MKRSRLFFPLLFMIGIFAVVSIACGSSASTPTGQVATGDQDPIQTSIPEQNTNTPKPVSTPTDLPIGMSRKNPYTQSNIVSVPNWDVQVLEVKRGDEAWADIQAANMFNEPAPNDMEFLLVKLHIKSTYADSDEHSISYCDFDVTGSHLILYTCSMSSIVLPEPQLDATLYSGGETEGWAGYLVYKGEDNLLLVVDESLNFDQNAKRYIALEEGASIEVSSDVASIVPNDVGVDRVNPAKISEKVVTENWEFEVLEVKRGAEAWTEVQNANQFNDAPLEGMEYILVKIHVRNIGSEDKASNIDWTSFSSTGSASVLYEHPSVVSPSPSLDINLFPGGEYEGWVVVQAAVGETAVNLVYEPFLDFSATAKRYIALE